MAYHSQLYGIIFLFYTCVLQYHYVSGCTNIYVSVGASCETFSSDNYPYNYDQYENECWSVESDYGYVSLSFNAFNTESNYDFVKIRDGSYSWSTLIGSYSGSSSPSSITSSGEDVYVSFTSDGSGTRSGWQASACGTNTPGDLFWLTSSVGGGAIGGITFGVIVAIIVAVVVVIIIVDTLSKKKRTVGAAHTSMTGATVTTVSSGVQQPYPVQAAPVGYSQPPPAYSTTMAQPAYQAQGPPQAYPQGQPQSYPPGQPQAYPPGQPQAYPPQGQPQAYPQGQPPQAYPPQDPAYPPPQGPGYTQAPIYDQGLPQNEYGAAPPPGYAMPQYPPEAALYK